MQSIALRGVEYGVALHVGDFPFGCLALGVGLGAGDAVGIDHDLGEASTFSGVTFAAAGAHVSGRRAPGDLENGSAFRRTFGVQTR